MNLSLWQDYPAEARERLLNEMGSEVKNRQMPVERYLLLHPEARLTESERQLLYSWTRAERKRLRLTNGINDNMRPRPATRIQLAQGGMN